MEYSPLIRMTVQLDGGASKPKTVLATTMYLSHIIVFNSSPNTSKATKSSAWTCPNSLYNKKNTPNSTDKAAL
jgi:hypothetical protein